MKNILCDRLIYLGKQNKQPGFDDDHAVLMQKFSKMPDKELLVFFELIVIQSHAQGIQ